MTAMRVKELESSSNSPNSLTFFEMMQVHRLEELQVMEHWRKNRTYESMKAMVGYKAGNIPCYQDIYEKNGVSYDTFKKYMQASNEDYVYFEHLYGEDGEKAVKKSEVMKFIKEHFVADDTAYYSLTDSDGNTVDSKTSDTYKKKLNNYADKLNAGKISFKKV